ncbi:MAG: hypothetical protein ABN482_10770 [Corticimicrobacter sp.]|uniref:hypothetical protein n=1 Tax=Corticimicrobacter sp. TaxID=2678536 RepID=UPI0032DA1B64
MDFQSFIAHGQVSVAFGTTYEALPEGVKTIRRHDIDKASGAFALYPDGIELLFEDGRLCLVQYEIARLGTLCLAGNLITGQTSLQDFKGYLDAMRISYTECTQDDQQILVTTQHVKIYFENGMFATALKSW